MYHDLGIVASDHLAEDPAHFLEREGPQDLGPNIAERGGTERQRRRALIVRRFENRNDIVTGPSCSSAL